MKHVTHFLSANERLQTQTGGKIRPYAHDRHQPIGLAQRPGPRDQTRDPDVLQPREQLPADLPQDPLQGQRPGPAGGHPRPPGGRPRSPHRREGPEGPAQALRVQENQHHRFLGARCVAVSVPLHHRVQSDLRRHTLRHVEEYFEAAGVR